MANGQMSFSFKDYNGEASNVSFGIVPVTALNLAGLLTWVGTLRTAVDGITLCNITGEAMKVFNTKLSGANATDASAHRERKWLVRYEDNQQFFDPPVNAIPNEGYGKVFNIEIPGADSALLLANSDKADLANPAVAAFVTAFEANARSPHGGTCNVIELVMVGRNL